MVSSSHVEPSRSVRAIQPPGAITPTAWPFASHRRVKMMSSCQILGTREFASDSSGGAQWLPPTTQIDPSGAATTWCGPCSPPSRAIPASIFFSS